MCVAPDDAHELTSQTLGQAVASLAPTILAATYCNPFLLVILSLLCGVTIVRSPPLDLADSTSARREYAVVLCVVRDRVDLTARRLELALPP